MVGLPRRALLAGIGLASLPVWAWADGIGRTARPFRVFTTEWKTIDAADLRDKVVVLVFWTYWSQASIDQLTRLGDYARRHPGAPMQILAALVVEDSRRYDAPTEPLPFPSVRHLNGGGYGLIGDKAPTIYVIDRSGVLRYAAAAALTEHGLEQAITPLLTASVPIEVTSTLPSVKLDDLSDVTYGVSLRPTIPSSALPVRR